MNEVVILVDPCHCICQMRLAQTFVLGMVDAAPSNGDRNDVSKYRNAINCAKRIDSDIKPSYSMSIQES